ncbi:TPA: tryptophan synthase subunit alpha [Candidatus Nomurabacteria bacterium]|uniref:Tryptophan synthase alpha chain n=2 Tax=Candidatus Nomuraibacteriota TaxID=1752729 RepID=A0A1F6YLV9_9BACT|nr:MAG: Tryptophan synthase alpha chain [Parcubacteria group bacterium GW2011_GWC1_42_21]KKS58580.1 MAG: Tryptophan synthase alpha chain [Candidatus Nomurabacteria bacterium GW2011_GWF1_42_40]KKT00746.1 MAG: Tryptophan synthase alpha chain [Candidatus Nomurabacteria bacterium GW2011_GWA1_43_17]KKT07944.1 MAG: Tryptophan synthase alpha chain [Candidatus Nomurabacteria bacterium GW2011_GWB1_43_19]KKT11905.1 MAG: Tryptophan synthase alpha chain [Candidatus Nomurabacteria bacterium GW2011_GWF2_43_2
MNRIETAFTHIKKEGKLAMMPFLVAGFPNFSQSLKILKVLSQHSDLLEIGFPYSDPLADGPVIQKADQVALKAGSTTSKVFELIKNLRLTTEIPITVLVYANLVYQRGIEKFYRDARNAGIDGVLIPDVPFEEISIFLKAAKKYNIDNIYLIATTTTPRRLNKITKVAQGYLYLTSVVGITGTQKDIPRKTLQYIKQIKRQTRLPIAVGFGISNLSQVKKLKINGADGVIIGSSLIKLIQKSNTNNPQTLINFLKNLNY